MKIVKFTALATALVCLLSTVEAAPTRYFYTGNPFNFFAEGVPEGTDRITGFFDVDDPLGPNFDGVLGPTKFEFSDGVSTITETATLRESFLHAVTDDTGELIAWNIILALFAFNEGDHATIFINNDFDLIPSILDSTSYCAVDNGSGDCGGFESEFPGVGASILQDPGSWTITVVPIPAAVWLFGSALGLLAWMRRKAT